MWIHGLPNGFCDAGHDVLVSGALTENGIQDMVSRFQPDLIVTLGHTPEHTEEKQQWIRKYVKPSGIPHVYWATEDPGYIHTFSLPLIKTTQPDFVFTICLEKVAFYKEQGIRAAHLDFGYHSSVHHPAQTEQRYAVNLAVVANGYPMLHKERPDHFRFQAMNRLLSPFLKENKRIDFWGRYWDQMDHIIGKPIPKEWIHGYLPYTEANKVYSSADIILGIQNHLTQVTQRTYEILGSGGLLLTNDTPEVRRMFQPGEDLLVSSSAEETVKLVNYYLNHPEERKEIVKSGVEKVKRHSYEQRARYIIKTLIQAGLLSNEKARPGKGSLTDYSAMLSKEYEIYQVQPNDTLWAISIKSGISVEQIKRLNGLKTDLIKVNQTLKLKEK
nr:glycosyltransferase [Bacillus ectoiniformans]